MVEDRDRWGSAHVSILRKVCFFSIFCINRMKIFDHSLAHIASKVSTSFLFLNCFCSRIRFLGIQSYQTLQYITYLLVFVFKTFGTKFRNAKTAHQSYIHFTIKSYICQNDTSLEGDALNQLSQEK